MSKNKWFTIFWLDGSKTHVFGETIEAACNHAGIGNGALRAVDWYDEGIKNTHFYDGNKKEWVKFQDMEIGYSDFLFMSLTDVLDIMKTHNIIVVKFENQDIVVFKHDWSLFYLNNQSSWVEYIELSFGEYFKGTYGGDSDDEENEHHYMMANGQYFSPNNIAFAVECFINRVKKEPFRCVDSHFTESLENIHSRQRVSFNE